MRARRRQVVDEYVEDGRAAVYSEDGVVVLLSELATTAWGRLDEEWRPATQIATELVGEFGEPPGGDAVSMTEAALRSLAEQHLVDLDEESPA
ncbi:MAG: hypothetical protein QM747_08685 [Nocardioides sp.]